MAGSKDAAAQDEHRTTHINAGTDKNPFCDNTISTSKYTAVTFIPRSLFEQFRRIANVYFLFISILMLIGTYLPKIFESPLSAYSTLGPLCLVLAITMAKEGAEDWKRHKSDDEVNNRKAPVVQADGSEKEVLWRDLRVGQIVRVRNRQEVPADLILLQTSEPKSVCYVETSNIDGETNLKLKEALTATASVIDGQDGSGANKLDGDIVYDQPNDRIHNFTGKMRVEGAAAGPEAAPGEYFPVGARNMVLRGCTLRNTKWIEGLVVYTGKETKVMKKSGGARSKMSQVEKTMNTCIKIVFAAQIVLCSITTIAEAAWSDSHSGQYPYLLSQALDLWYKPAPLGNWFTFLLLFNNFIPISLYVTVELVNYAQAGLIGTDGEMYDEDSDTPAKARTSTLNQDLGQIEYVFSDKTGTLTRNVMEFKQCSIAGKVFGSFTPEAERDEQERAAKRAAHHTQGGEEGAAEAGVNPAFQADKLKAAGASNMSKSAHAVALGMDGQPLESVPTGTLSGFDDASLYSLLRFGPVAPRWGESMNASGAVDAAPAGVPSGPWTLGGQTYTWSDLVKLEAFMTCMAVCHTVVPEADEKNANAPPIYQAESPDEAALTKAARDVGFEFLGRQADYITVRRTSGSGSKVFRFDILGVHEFNSTRKRMSVLARCPDGRVLLMCKGADNVIFERSIVSPEEKHTLDGQLTRFAETGLRTLVLSQRWLSPAEEAEWKAEFTAASVALSGREDKLAAVAEKFEVGMTVLGATAIEDRLQEGVPGTIRDLRRAGIKTWVLTGDKVETAINIGFSARLLDPSMELIQITSEDPAVLRTQLLALEAQFKPLATDGMSLFDRFLKAVAMESKKKSKALRRSASGRSLRNMPASAGLSVRVLDAAATAAKEGPGVADAINHGQSFKGHTNMAVVVTGPALSHILGHEDLERAFLTVSQTCKSVVACRVSPQQKANIVKLVRQGLEPKPLTLAIGDGANDVGMIQRAEVGVGISGKEGLQAANAADFSIAQFRFLKRLLLVHGRWDYRRMTKVVLYSFYKNVVITLSLFYFNALTGFSGTSFYESLVYSTYNFVLGLPIIFIGILDRDISAKTALDHPSVYAAGLYYMDLNVPKMLKWIGTAVVHSTFVFWIPYGVYRTVDTAWSSNGHSDGMAVAGFTTFSCLVWGMQLSVAQQTLTWTWLNWLMLAISMVVWYIFVLGYNTFSTMTPEFYGVAIAALSRPAYYLSILATLGLQALYDLTVESLRTQLFPDAVDIARELDKGYGAGEDAVWGDEETEDERYAAAQGLVTTAALDPARLGIASAGSDLVPSSPSSPVSEPTAPGSSSSASTGNGANTEGGPNGARAAAGSAGAAAEEPASAPPGSVPATASTKVKKSKKTKDSTGTDGTDSSTGSVLANTMRASRQESEGGVPPPPLPAMPKPTAAPHPTPAASAAVSGYERGVFVPKEAVLGGADSEQRKAMGIVQASQIERFDYSGPAKGSGSGDGGAAVPEDGPVSHD